MGKTDNCQVAVVACLSNGDFASMVDARLYLPRNWCDDKMRCDQAKIPSDQRTFKTKAEIAYEMVMHQLALGTGFDFVGADGFYGNDSELAEKLDSAGCLYMLDIHANQQIFLEKPEWGIPDKKGPHGRPSVKAKPDKPRFSVDEYFKALDAGHFETINVRNTAKGKLKAQYHFTEVYVLNKTHNAFVKRLLVIRKIKTKSGFEIKFSFTNANLGQYTGKAIAYMQAQRFFVEHCIKESKQALGLNQFQTRKWLAWQHQVAVNIMIACFIMKEKLLCFDDLPLLSALEVREWICFKLSQTLTDEEMIDRVNIFQTLTKAKRYKPIL